MNGVWTQVIQTGWLPPAPAPPPLPPNAKVPPVPAAACAPPLLKFEVPAAPETPAAAVEVAPAALAPELPPLADNGALPPLADNGATDRTPSLQAGSVNARATSRVVRMLFFFFRLGGLAVELRR